MVLARVAGTVVSSAKEARLEGMKLLLLEKVDPVNLKGKDDYVVALDAVGAGKGELVFYVSGSSSRQTASTSGKPGDAAVIGIVDVLELDGTVVYRKDEQK